MLDSMQSHAQFTEMNRFYKDLMNELKDLKNIKISFCLNDNGDVLIRMKPKTEYLAKLLKNNADLAEFNNDSDEEN